MATTDESVIKRILPHNTNAEQSVIASMLLDNETISTAADILTAEDFYNYQYGKIFDAIISLYNSKMAADIITVQNCLRESNVSPELYSVEFLSNIIASVPTSANIRSYATIVYEKSILRKTIKASEAIASRCYQDKEATEDILEDAEKEIFKISQQSRHSGDLIEISDAVVRAFSSIQEASKVKGNVTGLRTGFSDLDYYTSGLQRSDFIIIAARAAMGKTAFALSMVEYIAVKSKIPTAVFSLEMSDEQLVKRLMAQDAGIDLHAINTGDLTGAQWSSLVESTQNIADSKLFLIDNISGLTLNDICSKCRKLKLEQDIQLVVIDYLQLIELNKANESKKPENRQQEVSKISRALKSLARELNIPIVALCQLNRDTEKREDRRPRLSDIRESGSIEQDADIVMFLYRAEVYNQTEDNKGKAQLIIGKHRNGRIGTIDLAWIGEYTKYANAQQQPKNVPQK